MSYLKKNKSGFEDCQIVTALNAHYCLTGNKPPDQDSEKYEQYIDMCGARYGAAISTTKLWDLLNIQVVLRQYEIPNNFPAEVSLWHARHGFHSALAIDSIRECDAFRIINFNRETTRDGWIFGEHLRNFICSFPDKKEDQPLHCWRVIDLIE